ncbi:MAG TPA: hypothetical protein VGA38_00800 [Candidatus Limnocylindria bacterium]
MSTDPTVADGSSGMIQYVCVSRPHYRAGRSVPDGRGSLTIIQGRWAYCAAARPAEKHEWQEIQPVPVQGIRHARSWTAPA